MRRTLFLLFFVASCGPAGAGRISDPVLQRELLAHGTADQAIRDTLVQLLQSGAPLDSGFGRRMMTVDSTNTEWLKGIIAARGWPRRSVVGPEAAEAAFLIVQHAVQDTAFMAGALALMEPLVTDSEVRGADVAMLADRLAVQRGGKQRYGTQAKIVEGRIVLDPIDDSAHVDERRAALGMPSLARNVAVLESLYTARPKP
jgi:uncharacterized protein DUF6624